MPNTATGRILRCHNCGNRVTAAGRDGPGGLRYCRKRECQRARQQAKRAPVEMETRPCSSCGRAMPSRPKRVSDLPDGRWCRDTRCQAARAEYLERLEARRAAELRFENGLKVEAFQRAAAAPRVTCTRCGRTDVVRSYMHPTPDMTSACSGEKDHLGVGEHWLIPPIQDEEIPAYWPPQ